MSNIKKISLFVILIIFISFSNCFAIDESQFTNNNVPSSVPTESNSSVESPSEEIPNDSEGNTQSSELTSDATENTSEEQSTTVSSITPAQQSNNSTITNILNIALIVVGILLILLAIAILLRLHQ